MGEVNWENFDKNGNPSAIIDVTSIKYRSR
jgi:hypothetical protein